MPTIVILGTLDTKLHELLYLQAQIHHHGGNTTKTILVDCGRFPTKHDNISVTQNEMTTQYSPPNGPKSSEIASLARGEVINHMIDCTTNWLFYTYNNPPPAIHGIIAAGGTGNTALASAVMRAVLPLGFPKLIVSTNASADVSPVVGETDICMMPSIVDIAGSNELLNRILSNAAGAIVGMSKAYGSSLNIPEEISTASKKRVGLSMFGVTTPAITHIQNYFSVNYPQIECFVFHQTGAGGRAMERLVSEDGLDAVLDLTTTELCDHICGGVMDSGPHRLEAALKKGIPYVISCGALDMCNFGPKSTVPERYSGRKLFEHNPTVTLMRTSLHESKEIGEFMVEKIKKFTKDKTMVQVVLPLGGVSVIATPDGPFYDKEADETLFTTLGEGLKGSGVEVVEDERAINDEGFAVDVAKRLVGMMGLG